ncbi:MAG TPA: PAS domain-containing protein [Sedimentisphaerales bacterium]|nr:PAS domain-containing protein [Sedimentisphaerales bacterium]
MLFERNKWKTMVGERKRVEQMLRHLGMISEKTEEGIVVIDLRGTIHFVNTAWAKMHGYQASKQLLGKHIHAFHNMTQMQTAVNPSLEQTKRTGEFAGQIEHVRRDGHTFPTHTKMIVLKDEKDEPAGIMVFAKDVTELRRLQDELNETAGQLEKLKLQIGQSRSQIAEHEQIESELQKYCDQLEQRIEELTAESKVVKERRPPQTVTREPEPAAQASMEEREQRRESAVEVSSPDQEETDQTDESREMLVPLDPKKLKAIADMAKRLR